MADRRGIKRAHESPQKNNSPFQHETDEYSGCTGDDEDYENYWNRRQAESDQEAETQLEKEEDEKVADFGTIDKYVAAVKRGGVAIQMKQFHKHPNLIRFSSTCASARALSNRTPRWYGTRETCGLVFERCGLNTG